jgi:hypothetical protein
MVSVGQGVTCRAEAFVRARWVRILQGVATPLFLAGCAMLSPMPRPADFPFHVAAPPVDIHWRLSLPGDVAWADGLVERRQIYVASAWLQLLGLDASDRIVSFTAPTWVRWAGRAGSRSPPEGSEQRFEIRLFWFEYLEEVSP